MYLCTYHISFLCVSVSIYHQSGLYAEILDLLLFIKTCLEVKLTIKIGVIHSMGILFLKQPKKNMFNMCCQFTRWKLIFNTNHIFLFNLQFMLVIHSSIELVLNQTLQVNDMCNNNFHSDNKYPPQSMCCLLVRRVQLELPAVVVSVVDIKTPVLNF